MKNRVKNTCFLCNLIVSFLLENLWFFENFSFTNSFSLQIEVAKTLFISNIFSALLYCNVFLIKFQLKLPTYPSCNIHDFHKSRLQCLTENKFYNCWKKFQFTLISTILQMKKKQPSYFGIWILYQVIWKILQQNLPENA